MRDSKPDPKAAAETSDFDGRAETWDEPAKVARAEAVAAAIRRAVPLAGKPRALEYGAGTGLLSFCLRDSLGPITLADRSSGMRAVAERKIAAAGAKDMRVVDLDLMRDPVPPERYGFIFTMLTLHHVPDVPRVLTAFHEMLDPAGRLCIADLDAEDGSFHGQDAPVHRGFERGAMRRNLEAAGFTNVAIEDCGAIEREDGRFGMFLACGRKG